MTKIVKLYGGEHIISFDDGAHCYVDKSSGLPVPGVTSILQEALPKPALLQWAANMAAGYMFDFVDGHGWFTAKPPAIPDEDGDPIGPVLARPISHHDLIVAHDEAKKAHRRKKEAAGDIGSEVHAFCERALVEQRVKLPQDPQARKAAEAFLTWLHATDLELIQAERIIFSKRWWYCGTTDCFGKLHGTLSVIDFKTGSGFWPDHQLQLAAYAVALEEETGETIRDGYIIHLDKKTAKVTEYHVPLTQGQKDHWLRVKESRDAIKANEATHKEIRGNARAKAA